MELCISSRHSSKERQIDILLAKLQPPDLLIVNELSRIGRSVGEIITTVDILIKQSVKLIAIKEGIRLSGKHDLQSKIMITLVGLFAEIERDLISVRTKEGLAAARASVKRLSRPKGMQSRVAKMEAGDSSVSTDLLIKALLYLGLGSQGVSKCMAHELKKAA